jgi:hypothetical protein
MVDFPQRKLAHILPPSATEYERTLADQVNRLLDLNIPIRELWNPWTCPADMLPYLAWALSVDIWDSFWDDTKKRVVIANAIKHHRIKGTLAAIETYLGLIGSTVIKATTPPAKIFSGPSLTREQREKWLEGLPQVRVWQQYETSVSGKRIFSGGQKYSSFFNRKFPEPNDAMYRLRRRARWIVNGVETDSKVELLDGFFRVYRTAVLKYSTICNQTPRGRHFMVPSRAMSRIATIEPISVSPWRTPVGNRLEPVSTEPEIVAQTGTEGHAVYSHRPFGNRYYVPSMAKFRLYERYAVYDGSAATKRPSIQFMGVGRYGIHGHTAELKVQMRTNWPRWKAAQGILVPKTKFWLPHDSALMEKNRFAVVAAKKKSDTVLLDTNTAAGFIAGLPFSAGTTFLAA